MTKVPKLDKNDSGNNNVANHVLMQRLHVLHLVFQVV